MRLECGGARKHKNSNPPQPRDFKWSGIKDLPVHTCPECGWHSQSEISLYVTGTMPYGARPKTYAEALDIVLKEKM